MNTQETIRIFSEFFTQRGHSLIQGSTLIPPVGDPVLFTTSGMHPLTTNLEGTPHPLGNRLVNVQRCLRTTDLEEVGDPRHLTVFEMLGTWSLGDYDGKQSLRWGYELLTEGFGIDKSKLHVTVFGGNTDLGLDIESLHVWEDIQVPNELTLDDSNWWSNGPTGPCGPDSEIFVWTGLDEPEGTPSTDDRWVEVWNHVMMLYRRNIDGSLTPLTQRNVDTGMGLERLLMITQGKSSVFETDLLVPWTRSVENTFGSLPLEKLRVVCDHVRSSLVVVGDGVVPSNTGRGYVLRRLLRRSFTTLMLYYPGRSLSELPKELLGSTLEHFQLSFKVDDYLEVLVDEERRFEKLLNRGRPLVERRLLKGPLLDSDYFYFHDTHGLPLELVELIVSQSLEGN